MNVCSIMTGYFVLNNFKSYGQTKGINNDNYFALLGSASSTFGCMRFIWSAMTDKFSYKLIYGILLTTQASLCFTLPLISGNQWSYAIWICLFTFCEGGHFTLLPNVLKKIYQEHGTRLYGILYSYTGVTAVLILLLQ